MATNIYATGELQTTYERRMLQRFRTTTVFNKWGVQKSIPQNGGMNLNFRRMEIIRPVATASTVTWPADAVYTAAAGALLTEGTFYVPSVIATITPVICSVAQYGQAAYISDVQLKQAIDDLAPEYVENFSEAMTELLDLRTRDIWLTNTNVQYANGRTDVSSVISGDFLNLVELRKAKRTLKRANAKPLEDGKYVVVAHPDTVYDLESDSNITNVWTYGGAGTKASEIFDPTIRDLPMGFRLYETSLCPISRASGYGDVYNTFVVAQDAYGTAELSSLPNEVIRHPAGSSGVADALNQVATIGWKVAFGACLLNTNNMVMIKHQASVFTGTRAGL